MFAYPPDNWEHRRERSDGCGHPSRSAAAAHADYAAEVRALGGAAVHDTIASAESCEVSRIKDVSLEGEPRFVLVGEPAVPGVEGVVRAADQRPARDFAGLTAEQVVSALPAEPRWTFAFLIDSAALSQPEHPILVVDLRDERGRTFRVIPSQVWAVENNLSIANMDFAEFANAVDGDGVFRGSE